MFSSFLRSSKQDGAISINNILLILKLFKIVIEIKGDQFFKSDWTMQCPFNHSLDNLFEAKHQCMLKNNIQILTTKDYKQYLDYIKKTYGNEC